MLDTVGGSKYLGAASLLRFCVLVMAWIVGFASRLFAVIRFESIIHEFDPWFNYRATHHMVEHGFYKFLNWFDERAWYPLGRIVGGTVYPGLMITSGSIHYVLSLLNVPVHIRDICVFLAPIFSGLTALATYFLTRELWDEAAGLFAACFIAIAPGYTSRSVAGSYDNEGIAIFALMFTYYLWIKSVKTGGVLWSVATALSYFYMVSAWGGYVFIINLIPLHVFTLLLMNRFSQRVYVAYTVFFVMGLLMSMQIPFVGFQPVRTSEHMAAIGVFGLLNAVAFLSYLQTYFSSREMRALVIAAVILLGAVGLVAVCLLTWAGYVAPWSGRFYSLWDTGYAKIHIPIIASVSEHQPTTWFSFFFDLHILVAVFPVGLWYCVKYVNDERVFIVLYAVTAVYFAGVMVRLMLTLTPCVCVLAAIAFSHTFKLYLVEEETLAAAKSKPTVSSLPNSGGGDDMSDLTGGSGISSSLLSTSSPDHATSQSTNVQKKKFTSKTSFRVLARNKDSHQQVHGAGSGGRSSIPAMPTAPPLGNNKRMIVVLVMLMVLMMFAVHCTWITSNAYSSPSIVLASYTGDGSRVILDDFREAYYWLAQNTADDARVMSWWDYGYQIAGMANRTTLVDNNTWNNSHIALVGKAMSSNESVAYTIMRALDVDYVLVIFGGVIGYSGDDINKFLWMVRIAGGEHPQEIRESDYFNAHGEFRVDSEGSPTLLNCLMYKLSYYRFGDMQLDRRQPAGFDRTRNSKIGNKDIRLEHLEEAYTSEHWLVRIYRVKKQSNRPRLAYAQRVARPKNVYVSSKSSWKKSGVTKDLIGESA